VFIPDVAFLDRDWVYVAGVALALWVGVVARKETCMLLTVVALSLGLSTGAAPAAGYVAMLLVLPMKFYSFIRPG